MFFFFVYRIKTIAKPTFIYLFIRCLFVSFSQFVRCRCECVQTALVLLSKLAALVKWQVEVNGLFSKHYTSLETVVCRELLMEITAGPWIYSHTPTGSLRIVDLVYQLLAGD